MKKLILLMLCLLLLSGCANDQLRDGEITAVYQSDGSGYTELLYRDGRSDSKVGLVITDETDIDSLRIYEDQIRNGEFSAAKVGVKYGKRLGKASFDQSLKLYEVEDIHVRSILVEDEYTLADGTSLDVWRSSSDTSYIWRTKDGTELLMEDVPTGPERVSVVGVDATYDDLSPEAKVKVREYYDEQGLLYNLDSELEAAYAEWLAENDKESFNCGYVSQSVSPVFANERIIYFLTTAYGRETGEVRLGAAFDKESGEYIDVWELFSIPEEEVRERIFSHTRVKLDPAVTAVMKDALKPEYIVFYSDYMEINFPSGTLPENRPYYNQIIDYENVKYMLNDWALPDLDKS